MNFEDKQRSILLSLIAGAVMLLPALSAAILSNSLIVLADLLQETSETLGILFSYFAVRQVSRGRDLAYNFGYGKLEGFSSLFIAGVIAISLVVILVNAWQGIVQPGPLTGVGVWIAIAANCLNGIYALVFWRRYARMCREEPSPIIEGQLGLFRGKFFSNFTVLFSLSAGLAFGRYAWAQFIDPVVALFLAAFLAYSAYTLFSASIDNLMDKTLEETLQIAILRALAVNFDRYDEFHDIRSRRSGSEVFVEVFLGFDPEKPMGVVMKDVQAVKAAIEKEIGGGSTYVIPSTREMSPAFRGPARGG
jgi:cation diffusion facilitator family transporter